MDSLTQITLGAAVGVAVMGRRTAAWKAALWGGIAGTLPDLDVFFDHGDAVLNMVRHRGESHSFFYLTLIAPLLAWGASRIHGEAAQFRRWWLALWLVLITHPLLDAMTIYGTQLLMPFSSYPFGVGSIFIIDPAYTVPLLVGVVAALRMKTTRGLRWNALALGLSTLYLGWSVLAQQHVERIARASLQAGGIAAQALLVTPAPLNTVLWRLVATTPDRYYEGFYSLLDSTPTVRWTEHIKGAELIEQHRDNAAVQRIAAFTKDLFSLQAVDGRLLLADLRMGQEPTYVFRFDVGSASLPTDHEHRPQSAGQRADVRASLRWLWHRIRGNDPHRLGPTS